VPAFGWAWVRVGLGPHSRVGVYGANSPEWMIAMQVRLVQLCAADTFAVSGGAAGSEQWLRVDDGICLPKQMSRGLVQRMPGVLVSLLPAISLSAFDECFAVLHLQMPPALPPRRTRRPATARTCTACRCTTRWER